MLTIQAGWDMLRGRWPAAALVAIFAIILAQYTVKIQQTENSTRSAFLRWRTQLESLDDGVNVWDKYAYPNPPIMAILLKPFMELPATLGATLWFGCKARLALTAIFMMIALLDSPERPFPIWAKLVAVGLSLRPIAGDLSHGNVNLLILFLVVLALAAFVNRRDTLAGVLLGLSIACKLTPALFILYFLWKRAWLTLAGITASLVVFVLLVPAAVYGWDNNLDYLQSWHRQMVAPYAAGVVSSEHKNQSLPGLLHRLLCDEPSFSDYDGDRKVVLETHNLADWDRSTVQAIVFACMAAFALLAMWTCRTPLDTRPRLELVAEASVVILGMLLFCERTWKHHCVTLLVPFCVLAYATSTPTFSRAMRWYLGSTLLVAGLLMASTSTGLFDRDVDVIERFGKLAQVYGAYTWAFLALLAASLAVLRNVRAGLRKRPVCRLRKVVGTLRVP